MDTPIRFTREAFKQRPTIGQRAAISRLAERAQLVEISLDFSLPSGYFAFRQKYNSETMSIHGGISPEGDVST